MSGRTLFLLACGAIVLSAASTPVGVLTTVGAVRVDGAEVRGNATVHDGSVIETANNPVQLSLTNDIRVDLAGQSLAQVYPSHIVLEQGASQIHANGFPIQVNSLSVIPIGHSATVRVFRANANKLQVAAVNGQAEVHNVGGLIIARVFPGSSLDFEEHASAAGPTKVSGRLEKKDGRYTMTDVVTRSTLELQGENLGKSLGHCITATGSADPQTAMLIYVATYHEISCKKLGLSTGVGAAAGAEAAPGLSTHAMIAIIGGVAVGGTVAGLAAAHKFSGGNPKVVTAP